MIRKLISLIFCDPPSCEHNNYRIVEVSHFCQICELVDFVPAHWPLNSTDEICRWVDQGFDHARVMQVHYYCTSCGERIGNCDFILRDPHVRTQHDREQSIQAIKNVVRLVA